MKTSLLHANHFASWVIAQFQENPSQFPTHGDVQYDQIFKGFESDLNANIHPHVGTHGALRNSGGFLTDHGPRHIEMVMRRASALINRSVSPEFQCGLTPYEGFLLLLSIHAHDVGNIYGRDGHESRIIDALQHSHDFQKLKPSERRIIAAIASTHGGTIDGSKDTIGLVLQEGTVKVLGQEIRPQLLAAILRLADELADEHSRAHGFGLISSTLPPESELYHRFAKCLESVTIDRINKKICLEFNLYPDDIVTEFGFKKKECGTIEKRFLIDEIHRRTRKTFCEMIYCMQFLREIIPAFNKVDVKLSAYSDPNSVLPPFRQHSYVIREKGYPGYADLPMEELCDNFEAISGEALKEECEKAQNQ